MSLFLKFSIFVCKQKYFGRIRCLTCSCPLGSPHCVE